MDRKQTHNNYSLNWNWTLQILWLRSKSMEMSKCCSSRNQTNDWLLADRLKCAAFQLDERSCYYSVWHEYRENDKNVKWNKLINSVQLYMYMYQYLHEHCTWRQNKNQQIFIKKWEENKMKNWLNIQQLQVVFYQHNEMSRYWLRIRSLLLWEWNQLAVEFKYQFVIFFFCTVESHRAKMSSCWIDEPVCKREMSSTFMRNINKNSFA